MLEGFCEDVSATLVPIGFRVTVLLSLAELKLLSAALVAVMEQVPLPLVTEITPLDALTEQPVDAPAPKLTVPVPEPPLAVAVPVAPNVRLAGTVRVNAAWLA